MKMRFMRVTVLGAALVAASLGLTQVAGSSETAGQAEPQVRDALGIRDADFMDPLPQIARKQRRGANPCGSFGAYGGGFHTSLGTDWTFLAARKGPCRAARARGGWKTGQRWKVKREAHGEQICRGALDGRASDVWYKSRKGWSWSGGTADPDWNESC